MKHNYFLKAVFTILLCGYFSMSYAADWYISSTGNDTNGDGITVETAWASFSKAQTVAAAGDVIHVSGMIDFSLEPGLVQPVGVGIAKNITIQGTSNTTDGFDGKGLTRFFSILNFNVTLKNLKLVNGYSGNNNGGALTVNTSTNSLSCENVVFDSNKTGLNTTFAGANRTGAAIQFDNVNGATFKKCVFSNNEASKTGAIYITAWAANSTILFESCAFLSNTAKESFGGSAFYIRANTSANTTLNLINCTIRGNKVLTPSVNGGAVFVGGKAPNTTNVNIVNCTITENTTTGTTSNGAGVYFLNTNAGGCFANLYISNSIIEGNTAAGGAYSDLAVGATSPTAPGGTNTVGYIKVQNSIIGAVPTDPLRVPAATNIVASPQYNYLTSTSTTNDLKAGLAPFNATTNSYSLYTTSAAIGYGASALLTAVLPANTDQLTNVRTANNAGSIETTPLVTTTPDAPTVLVATAGDGQVSVSFKSAATGGSPVTNYKYSVNDGSYVSCDPAVTSGPVVITGLANNMNYTVKLKAVNANGESAESVASNSVTPTGTTGLTNELSSKIQVLKNQNNQIIVMNAFRNKGMVTVCNGIGQRIATMDLNGPSTIINKSFASGVYLVTVKIEGKVISTKIIL